MPLKGLTQIVSNEIMFALLAASGGIARIVTGTTPPAQRTTWIGEACRIFFVAMPVGILSAMYVETKTSVHIIPYASSFTAGVVSLNIVRFLTTSEGLKSLQKLILRVFTGGIK